MPQRDFFLGFGACPAITACAEALRKLNTSGPNTEAPWVTNLREMLALEFLPTARDTQRQRSSNPRWSEHGPEASASKEASR